MRSQACYVLRRKRSMSGFIALTVAIVFVFLGAVTQWLRPSLRHWLLSQVAMRLSQTPKRFQVVDDRGLILT